MLSSSSKSSPLSSPSLPSDASSSPKKILANPYTLVPKISEAMNGYLKIYL